MPAKRNAPKVLLQTLREADVRQGQRQSRTQVFKQRGVTGQTFCGWRTECESGVVINHPRGVAIESPPD